MNETRGLWHGKRLDNGEWIIGYLMRRQGAMGMTFSYIMPAEKSEFDFNDDYVAAGDEWIPVETKTLGECTCVPDKKNTLIFEGDIVEYKGERYVIKYLEKYMRFSPVKPGTVFAIFDYTQSEIIGNIYDNPELMEDWKEKA